MEEYEPRWFGGVDENAAGRLGFEIGAEWMMKNILNTDAIVSMVDALMGHHPVPDALAKWEELHKHIDKNR